MICLLCRTHRHGECRGGTHCTCQHRPVSPPVEEPVEEPDGPVDGPPDVDEQQTA